MIWYLTSSHNIWLNIRRLFIILLRATEPRCQSDPLVGQSLSASVHECIKTYLHVQVHQTSERRGSYFCKAALRGEHNNNVKLFLYCCCDSHLFPSIRLWQAHWQCCWGNRLIPTSPPWTCSSAVTPPPNIHTLTPTVPAWGVCHPPTTHSQTRLTHLHVVLENPQNNSHMLTCWSGESLKSNVTKNKMVYSQSSGHTFCSWKGVSAEASPASVIQYFWFG